MRTQYIVRRRAFESRSPQPLFTFAGIVTASEVFMCMFCIISLKLEAAHLVQVAGGATLLLPCYDCNPNRGLALYFYLFYLLTQCVSFVAVN